MRGYVSSRAIGSKVVIVWAAVLALAGGVSGDVSGGPGAPAKAEPGCKDIEIGDSLPLPCTLPLADYEKVLYRWINDREYTKLGWARDKMIRDTGPFILNSNYGTHPAVRIYYSHEVLEWLEDGRPADRELPIGSMIIKEMYPSPAARWNEALWTQYKDDPEGWESWLRGEVDSWTIMIKDDQTRDGWFWSGVSAVSTVGKTAEEYAAAIAATVDTNDPPFHFRGSGYGQADCLRCHSSAQSETTFVDLDNLEGDDALRFRVDAAWRADLAPEQRPGRG